jgi:hypothetical protein
MPGTLVRGPVAPALEDFEHHTPKLVDSDHRRRESQPHLLITFSS